MNLLSEIKTICKAYNIYPTKAKGQNFLIDKNVLNKIIKAADLKKDDVVLEIGPGLGILTFELAKKVKKVYAVELDKKLIEVLETLFLSYKNIKVIEGDILKLNFKDLDLKDNKYKIVANLPYNITSVVLRKFLENKPRAKEIVVMVQKEVAQRIVAKPGQMSLLSVSVQFYSQPEIVDFVSRNCFWPVPGVDSAILRIKEIRKNNKVDEKKFFQVVRVGFSSRRKQLQNNLAAGFRLPNEAVKQTLKELKIKENARAQELNIEQWIKLTHRLKLS